MKALNKGFTLVELIVVIGIISVLIVIFTARFNGYIGKVKEQVCRTNCRELEREYHRYLIIEKLTHNEEIFDDFLRNYSGKTCPENGIIIYKDGRLECSIHAEDNGDVPYI